MTENKVAIIGVGAWGKNMLRTVQDICTVTIIGYRSSGQTKLFLEETYPNIQNTTEMLNIAKNPSITAVFIATPIETHFEQVKLFLEHNKHVFVEKPLVVTTTQVKELYTLAEKNNRTLFTGYLYLFDTAFEKLTSITAGQNGELNTYWYKWGSFDSSIQNNLLVHEIATAYSLLGPVHSVVQSGIVGETLTIQLQHERGLSNIHIDRKSKEKRKYLVFTTNAEKEYTIENGELILQKNGALQIIHSKNNQLLLTTECQKFLDETKNGSSGNSMRKEIDFTVAHVLELLS